MRLVVTFREIQMIGGVQIPEMKVKRQPEDRNQKVGAIKSSVIYLLTPLKYLFNSQLMKSI